MGVATFNDPEFGEVKQMTGMGHVKQIDHESGKRNAYVIITADGLQHPLGGFIDTHTAPLALLATAQESLAEGKRVRYRIDLHRRESVPADGRGLDKLATNEKVRTLVALELLASTTDVHNGASGDTRPQDGAPGQNPPNAAGAPAGAAPPAADPDPGEIPPPGDDDAPPAGGRRAKLQEGKPWEEDNSDGSPNLGSYAVTACVAMVEWAWELLAARDNAQAPTVAQARALGKRLLFIADRVQATVRPDGRVDRMANSHVRARGAVRSAVAFYAVPFGGEPPDVRAWADDVTAGAVELVKAGVALLMDFEA